MALVWFQRSCPYVLGVLCLILSTLALATGLVVPFWVRQTRFPTLNIPSLNIGLWFMCGDDWVCFNHGFNSDKEYMHVTRGLHMAGALGEVICVLLIFIINCRRQYLGYKVDVGVAVVIFFSGLMGVSGPMVFLAYTLQDVEELSYLRYDWAFALSVGASALSLVSAFIFCASSRCGPGCSSSDNTKTEPAVNWQETPNYSEPGQRGVYGDGHDPYLQHPVHHHDLFYNDSRPLPLVPPGEQGHSSRLSNENVYSAYPMATRSERLAMPWGSQGREISGEDVGGEMMATDSWQEGQDMDPALSPSWREQAEERWYYRNPVSDMPESFGPEEVLAAEPPPMMELSPFMLPRVVVRGYYEPGYGHPEYVML